MFDCCFGGCGGPMFTMFDSPVFIIPNQKSLVVTETKNAYAYIPEGFFDKLYLPENIVNFYRLSPI